MPRGISVGTIGEIHGGIIVEINVEESHGN